MMPLYAVLMLPAMARGFSASNRVPAAAVALDRNVAQQDKAFAVDQAAWTSSRFWLDFENELKAAGVARHGDVLARFDSFTHNLKTEKPGDIIALPSGQELHKQYIYPDLDTDWLRTPFPAVNTVPGTSTLASCAAIARDELLAALAKAPLRNDDGPDSATGNIDTGSGRNEPQQNDTPWNRAAWYGWQFLPLRAEQQAFHGTIARLKAEQVPLGHRFVGVARQRANCRGTVHRDHRNYMLSTLTPLVVPGANTCGVMGYSQSDGSRGNNNLHPETKVLGVGETVVLDNSFPHEVYNHGDSDRFVLMAEVWHPSLTPVEQLALETLFACRDRFALFEFAERPWGVGQKELMAAIESGKVEDINFWKQVSDNNPSATTTMVPDGSRREVVTSVDRVEVGTPQAPNGGPKKGKPKKSGSKGTKTSSKRGFGAR